MQCGNKQVHHGTLEVAELLKNSFLVKFKIADAPPPILPHCMGCRRGLAMRKLSVCLSVKRVDCDKTEKRSVQIFLYHTKDHLAQFSENLGQPAPVGAKSPIFNRYSLVAPQP